MVLTRHHVLSEFVFTDIGQLFNVQFRRAFRDIRDIGSFLPANILREMRGVHPEFVTRSESINRYEAAMRDLFWTIRPTVMDVLNGHYTA